jgi:hypothetical protein
MRRILNELILGLVLGAAILAASTNSHHTNKHQITVSFQ